MDAWLVLIYLFYMIPFMLTLTPPNPQKSSKILHGALFWKMFALLETGTFTSSNGAKLLPGKKYRP